MFNLCHLGPRPSSRFLPSVFQRGIVFNYRLRTYPFAVAVMVCVVSMLALPMQGLSAQEINATDEAKPAEPQPPEEELQTDESALATPDKVNVEQIVGDDAIEARLQRILDATEWFENPQVQVEDGIVFLAGSTQKEK